MTSATVRNQTLSAWFTYYYQELGCSEERALTLTTRRWNRASRKKSRQSRKKRRGWA